MCPAELPYSLLDAEPLPALAQGTVTPRFVFEGRTDPAVADPVQVDGVRDDVDRGGHEVLPDRRLRERGVFPALLLYQAQKRAAVALVGCFEDRVEVLLSTVVTAAIHRHVRDRHGRIRWGCERLISTRRGHILGYDARPGWTGWDVVEAVIPESEIADLIIELRSATAGVGTFTAEFDHMAEVTGRLADDVLAQAGKQAA